MNEYDVQDAINRLQSAPNLHRGAQVLRRLVDWTNSNSDGWAYWPKPVRAAKSLQELLQAADRFDPRDVTEADLNKALRPIKAFLTRHGVDHSVVLL